MTPEEKDLLLKDLCARLQYGNSMYSRNNIGFSLKASYTHFLESHGFTHFFGVDSAIRGSKIISVFIKKEHKQEFEKLNGGTDGYRRYWVMSVWESEDSIKYSVSCRKV